jgi:hypothetical protein
MNITRKEFLRGGVAVVVSGWGLATCAKKETTTTGTTATTATTATTTATGAGGAGGKATTATGAGGTGGTTANKACTTSIANNHPPPGQHIVAVPFADVTAGVDKMYDIKGMADHSHTITLTAANFATLKAGTQVIVTSTTTLAHMHDVTVVCM